MRSEEARAKVEAMDDLLDEIDGLLEENAETFVKAYVQKGGQAVAVARGFLDWLLGRNQKVRPVSSDQAKVRLLF